MTLNQIKTIKYYENFLWGFYYNNRVKHKFKCRKSNLYLAIKIRTISQLMSQIETEIGCLGKEKHD